jgi:hypothetical protein
MGGFSLVTSVGASFPVAGRREPQWIDWHLHLSPTDFGDLVPLFEINGYHYTNNSRVARGNVEGLDLATLGASNVEGNDIVTGAVGFRYRVTDSADLGVAYERPLTERRDILRDRLTLDWIQRF